MNPISLERTYKTILADPPWPEHGGGKSKRGADRHYPLMSVRKIAALPVGELADPAGCHLWLWATGNYLADAIDCGRAWGFRYINFRPWVKAEESSIRWERCAGCRSVFAYTPLLGVARRICRRCEEERS